MKTKLGYITKHNEEVINIKLRLESKFPSIVEDIETKTNNAPLLTATLLLINSFVKENIDKTKFENYVKVNTEDCFNLINLEYNFTDNIEDIVCELASICLNDEIYLKCAQTEEIHLLSNHFIEYKNIEENVEDNLGDLFLSITEEMKESIDENLSIEDCFELLMYPVLYSSDKHNTIVDMFKLNELLGLNISDAELCQRLTNVFTNNYNNFDVEYENCESGEELFEIFKLIFENAISHFNSKGLLYAEKFKQSKPLNHFIGKYDNYKLDSLVA